MSIESKLRDILNNPQDYPAELVEDARREARRSPLIYGSGLADYLFPPPSQLPSRDGE